MLQTTRRPAYPPSVMLKIDVHVYLDRIDSSRRPERECQRNVELMWLTKRLAPDRKTIANFRKDNGAGVRQRMQKICLRSPQAELDMPHDKDSPVHHDNGIFYADIAQFFGVVTDVVENEIRPFAIGRKLWMFSDSQAGPRSEQLREMAQFAGLRRLLKRQMQRITAIDVTIFWQTINPMMHRHSC